MVMNGNKQQLSGAMGMQFGNQPTLSKQQQKFFYGGQSS